MRKVIKRKIIKYIPEVKFTQIANESSRITIPNMDAAILKLAEDESTAGGENEAIILMKTAAVLRKRTLEHMKNNSTNFDGTINDGDSSSCPMTLVSFFTRLLIGSKARKLGEAVNQNIDTLAKTLCSSVMFNIKSDRQASYKPQSDDYRPRHMYTPSHTIGLGLAVRRFNRYNGVLKLLSAPNYGFTMTSCACLLWETSIVNSVLKNMEDNGTYIPCGLIKDTPVFYHIDNVDWQEDTPDGKNTSHYLLLAAFQRKVNKDSPISLPTLNQRQQLLTLDENTFNDLLPYSKPSKSQFQRSPGSTNAQLPANTTDVNQNFTTWLYMRSFEHLTIAKEQDTLSSNTDRGEQDLDGSVI